MPIRVHPRLKPFAWFLPLAWLWFVLINHLRIEWTLNPQYNYGWAVPLLCVYLVWRRFQYSRFEVPGSKSDSPTSVSGLPSPASDLQSPVSSLQSLLSSFRFPVSVFAFLSLLYLPTRLIQEANPEWRFVSWALALEVVGITLFAVRQVLGAGYVATIAFPLCFFLVAVPWPTLVEWPLTQGLMRINVTATIDVLNLLGVAAVQHGNVIEIRTGVVGIDEACSGIRSFQATLMISLFFGELYRLPASRRLTLCCAGFALSFLFNVGRTGLLTWVAAHKGVEAVSKWHDPAGITILLGCFTGLWLVSVWLQRPTRSGRDPNPDPGPFISTLSFERSALLLQKTGAFSTRLSAFLVAWLILVEISVEVWYRAHERNLAVSVVWRAQPPADNPTLRTEPFSEKTRRMLRVDDALNVGWMQNGRRWQMIFFRWNAGKVAAHLAKGHTPEICLRAAGHNLIRVSELQWVRAAGLDLPVRFYTVRHGQQSLHVLYCLWEDRRKQDAFDPVPSGYRRLLGSVLAGRRNTGQRSVELAVWNIDDATEAESALRLQLEKLIVPGTERAAKP